MERGGAITSDRAREILAALIAARTHASIKRRCYIFDIDGTLADGGHRLHHILKTPKDWRAFFAACPSDEPIKHMIEVAQRLGAGDDIAIVYVSGRSDEVREQTEVWLRDHGLPRGPLYMRKAGDYTDDNLLKIEILKQVRADGYDPIMAFDDRARVVQAWRDAGIPCAQVAPGDF